MDKCISVRQPWATLIVTGFKCIESRSKITHFRGKLWVAATRKKATAADIKLAKELYPDADWTQKFPNGQLLGFVYITRCMRKAEYEREFEKKDRLYEYAYVCSEAKALKKTIEMKGQLGIYNLKSIVAEKANSSDLL